MARSPSRRRQMLLARAERIRAGVSHKHVEPLSRQLADLQAQLLTLSEATELPDCPSGTDAGFAPDLRSRPAAPREAPVVFLHIPKTAGTTATFWLMLLHGDRHMKAPSYTTGLNLESLTAKLRRADGLVESVAGHVPYSARSIFPARSSFFTFLREPVDRALSHFCHFHAREQSDDASVSGGAATQIAALEAALAAWNASSPESQAVLPDNLQTRMLSGFDMSAPASGKMLEAAKRNLGELDALGLTERFDESTALLHRVYGWRILALQSHRVKTHVRISARALEPPVLAGLRRLTALDQELYAEGALRFEAAIARFDETFSRDVEALRVARQLEMAKTNGEPTPPDDQIDPRTAKILADTAAAFDENPFLKAEKLLESLASSTKQLRTAASDWAQDVTRLTSEFRELMKRIP